MNYDSKLTKAGLVIAAAAVGAVCGLLLSAAAKAETFSEPSKVKYAQVRAGKAGVWNFTETMTIRDNMQEGTLCVGEAVFSDKLTMKFANVVVFPQVGEPGNTTFIFSITKAGWNISEGRQLQMQLKFTVNGQDTDYAAFPSQSGPINDLNILWRAQDGRDAAASLFARASAVTIAVKGKHVGRYNLKDTSKLLGLLAACESGGETF